jgi:MinD-like ATPase involved in chromosome partitioning or flagellar assembly
MSKTMLITVAGPEGRNDLAAPADTPVADLMPAFLELVGHQGNGRWELAAAGGRPLARDRTLAEQGIADGSVLELRSFDEAAVDEAPDEPAPPPLADDGATPLERTRRALPEKLGIAGRVGGWVDALIRRRDDETPERTFDVGDPRSLTRVKPSLLDRGRTSWRSSNYLHRLEDAIRAPRLRRCATIAVISPKGGVGKTTITALLGSLLALVRRDRAIAVDTNPDYGSLGRALTPEHEVYVDDFLDLLEQPDLTPTQLDANLGRSTDGLMVLPAPTDPARMSRLDRDAYAKVIERLKGMCGLLLLDCGTGLQEAPSEAAIHAADQLLLVSDSEPATASLIADAYGLLEKQGVPLTVVINKLPRIGNKLDLDTFQRLLPDARAITVIHNDPGLAARVNAGGFTWSDPAGTWERELRELAAVLVAGWGELGLSQ